MTANEDQIREAQDHLSEAARLLDGAGAPHAAEAAREAHKHADAARKREAMLPFRRWVAAAQRNRKTGRR